MCDNDNCSDKKYCSKCRMNLPIDQFSKKRNGDYKKTCDHCLKYSVNYYKQNKCLHNKYLYICVICKNIKQNNME